jgi:hypothetical protein
MKASELKKLKNSLKEVCISYSDVKNEKRRQSFGISMYERLASNIDFDTLYENQIIYKGAQWGGKWGNFYKAIYYRKGEFHYGSGFSNRQILS